MEADLNLISIKIGIIGIIIGIIGIIIGIIGIIFAIKSRKNNKKLNKIISEQNDKIDKLEKSNNEKRDETIKKYGFFPLRNENNKDENGLKIFEDRIVELAKSAKKNIKLCVVTPLLHSLRKDWYPYNDIEFDKHPDHWAKEFCENFINEMIKNKSKKDSITLDVDIIFLDDNTLRKIVTFIPPNRINWNSYQESINHFFSKLKGDIGIISGLKPLCNLNYFQIPDSPIYFALIDTPDSAISDKWDNEMYDNAKGIMTFINYQDLIEQRKNEGNSAEKIAQDLEGFEFSNKTILKFFVRLFNTLSLRNHNHLYDFYKIMNSHGYDWGMVYSSDLIKIIEEIKNEINNNYNFDVKEKLKILEDTLKKSFENEKKYYVAIQ